MVRSEGQGDLPQNCPGVSYIAEVKSKTQWKEFLGLPSRIYRPDSPYSPPLAIHLKMMLGSLKQPEKHLLVAYQNALPVARLGIKRHRHGDYDALHFGFYESLPVGPEPTRALFREARVRYPHLPLRGPYQFRMEDPYTGLLVEGFQQEPQFLLSYNPPYYDEYVRESGLKIAMDLFTYEFAPDRVDLDRMTAQNQLATEQGFTIRNLRPHRLGQEAQKMAAIFNDALSENWGFEELQKDQVHDLVTLGRLFLDPRLVFVAEKEGQPVGCAIILPNFNPIIKESAGKLNPGFLWNFLSRRRSIDTFRCYAIGIRKEFRKTAVSSMLAHAVMQAFKTVPWKLVEMSWILASNRAMNLMAIGLGGRRAKTYRIYEAE